MAKQQFAHSVELLRLLGRFWTLANMLSMIRLLLVVPITYLILTDGPMGWLFGLIGLALVTDWFDGRIARWSSTVSEWGKVLDPLADKIAGVAIVMALVVRGSLPTWFLTLLVVRDALIVLGGVVLARRTGHVVMSGLMGKIAVTALSLTVLAALLRADPPLIRYCVWITAGLMVYSFLLYGIRFVRLMHAGRLPDMRTEPGRGDGFRAETD
ncbi:MAG: CDP-alcohol phosphatidyltransferase family protein [Rhodothermales bacterium]